METELGKRIKLWRVYKEMTQDELGAAAGVSNTTIHNVEVGKGSPSIRTLARIVEGLGISMGQLWANNSGVLGLVLGGEAVDGGDKD
jgi:DNA-binding XRE family transcriptional regulator